MHKASSVLRQYFVDANAVKVKLLCQVERVYGSVIWVVCMCH